MSSLLRPHANLLANTEAIVRSQHLTPTDRAMLILPVAYCYGASVLHRHLAVGGQVVLDRCFMFPAKVMTALAEPPITAERKAFLSFLIDSESIP